MRDIDKSVTENKYVTTSCPICLEDYVTQESSPRRQVRLAACRNVPYIQRTQFTTPTFTAVFFKSRYSTTATTTPVTTTSTSTTITTTSTTTSTTIGLQYYYYYY